MNRKKSRLQTPFENCTIWQPDGFGPLEYYTTMVFGWLLFYNHCQTFQSTAMQKIS